MPAYILLPAMQHLQVGARRGAQGLPGGRELVSCGVVVRAQVCTSQTHQVTLGRRTHGHLLRVLGAEAGTEAVGQAPEGAGPRQMHCGA